MSNEMKRAKLVLLAQSLYQVKDSMILWSISQELSDNPYVDLETTQVALESIRLAILDLPQSVEEPKVNELMEKLARR